MTRRSKWVSLAWTLTLILLSGPDPTAAQEPSKPAADDPAKPAKDTDTLQPWLSNLADAYTQARRRRQPILVRVGSDSCRWCRKLEQELADPKVQAELGRWTLVALNADQMGRGGRVLAISAVPALRLLTPTGRMMGGRDGYLPADQLIAWLQENHDKTAVLPTEELTADSAPTPAVVTRLIGELKNRDPALREAAVRRLLPHAVLAAPAVAEAMERGTLQTRLSALELLREWQAPVQDLDPWNPETMTPARVKSLQQWAADPKQPAPVAELTPEQRSAVQRDLARLVQAPEVEAAAIRERLARYGSALLPEVYARLKDASADLARERLTALRYRLVASSALVLAWPGGLERLAATQTAQRHQAVQELAARATAAEESLLLELFSDPDPLVREIGLRGLHKLAGSQATVSLTRLLADPEPNVRAAVLKQLAEKPGASLVAPLRAYLAREKDTDLIVHAVRVLRGIDSKNAVASLKVLLKHESWRVRAEAAEAIGENLNRQNYSLSAEAKADVYAVLAEVLKDEDGFVVSRAVKSLKRSDSPMIVEPLVQAAQAHPDLTAEVIAALTYHSSLRDKAIPHLRKFCSHASAEARAAAIQQLSYATEDVESEMRATLKDASSTVRIAAANALFRMFESRRTRSDENDDRTEMAPATPPPSGILEGIRRFFGKTPPKKDEDKKDEDKKLPADPDAGLLKSRAGEGRPKWMAGMTEVLLPLLAAESAEERLAAALPLVALAQEEKALPVLLEVAKAHPDLVGASADALQWLPWKQRQELYQQLLALRPRTAELTRIIGRLARVPDKRGFPLLWALTGRDDVTPELAGALVSGLRQLHFGNGYNTTVNNRRQIAQADRKLAIIEARPRAESGPEMQRLIALAVLLSAASEEAVIVATKVLEDGQASAELRGDAFQLLLLCRTKAEATRSALAALSHAVAPVRYRALYNLTTELEYGSDRIRDGAIDLDVEDRQQFSSYSVGESRPWVPDAPKGLTAEMVRPLLNDPDPGVAARASYLLVLLGESAGLEPLVRHWRERAHDNESWAKLVYRAVAALGDDGRVSILDEIYRMYEAGAYYRIGDFYWTIRIMDGPNALRLRKLMRQEMGMDRLR